MKYWMNIDKPTKKCVLHKEKCVYVIGKEDTSLKGVGKIKKDGGWLSFASRQDAENHFERRWASLKYKFSERCRCLALE